MLRKRTTIAMLALIALCVLGGVSAWAAADLEEGVKELADKITKNMIEKAKHKIAIVDFSDLSGNVTALGQFMAEELTTQLFLLAPGKFEVVERRQLLKLEEELILGQTGVLEEKGLKKMGQVLGVEAIVTGSMTDLGQSIKVNARMIAVESAKVFAVAATSIPKTGIVADLASKAVERRQVAGTPGAAQAQREPASGRTPIPAATTGKRYQEFPKIRVEVEGLRVGSEQVTAYLTYFNKTDEELLIALDHPKGNQTISGNATYCTGVQDKIETPGKTYLLDSEGNRYEYVQASGLSGGWYGIARTILDCGQFWAGDTAFLKLPPNGKESVALTFAGRGRVKTSPGTVFDVISGQVFVEVKDIQALEIHLRGPKPFPSSSFTISIRNIEPREK